MVHPEFWIVVGFALMVGSAWIDKLSSYKLNMFNLSKVGFFLFLVSCFVYFFKQ